ncbi:MAG: RND family transporter [Christensenellales bacterium]
MPKENKLLYRFSAAVLRHRRIILILALFLSIVSLLAMQYVHVNYDLAVYLPADAPSTRALNRLEGSLPNLLLYLPGVSPQEALLAKEKLAAVPYVEDVIWIDDMQDVRGLPWEMIPQATRDQFYQEGGALYQLTVSLPEVATAFRQMRALYPEAIYKGDAANQAQVQTVSMGEVASIMYYVLPLVLVILLLSTSHWFEPLLFFLAIGIAILLNEGSNLIFGSVSFITQACSAVLQLAVSIDYAVFLLHRFGDLRAEGLGAGEAMALALQQAASTIAASAMTTVFGFLALLAMDFGMGADMGLVLAKGVLLSYFSVMVVLPAAAVASTKWIDKTAHRRLMPAFRRSGRAVIRFGAPLAILLILLLPLAYLGQGRNDFVYGTSGMHAEGSAVKAQAAQIDRLFGRRQTMLLMVPEGHPAEAAALGETLRSQPFTTSVISYASAVGTQIPSQMVPPAALAQLREKGYDRIILNVDSPEEGPEAFGIVRRVRELAGAAFQDDYYLVGENVINYDLMETITGDNLRVLLIGVLAIGLVLLVTFRSLSIPLILLLVIEGSIWLNMAMPYFTGSTMNYIGYQIVSSVQLGATVDYGILLSQRYMEARSRLGRREAAAWALSKSAGSILPPMMILTIAGYVLSIVVRSNGVISQMGEIIGRGAAISGIMVLLVLPHILCWSDRLIMKTTLSTRKVIKK